MPLGKIINKSVSDQRWLECYKAAGIYFRLLLGISKMYNGNTTEIFKLMILLSTSACLWFVTHYYRTMNLAWVRTVKGRKHKKL